MGLHSTDTTCGPNQPTPRLNRNDGAKSRDVECAFGERRSAPRGCLLPRPSRASADGQVWPEADVFAQVERQSAVAAGGHARSRRMTK